MSNKKPNGVSLWQVDNGYTVDVHEGDDYSGRFVFQSFSELLDFLGAHFTHRNTQVHSDVGEE